MQTTQEICQLEANLGSEGSPEVKCQRNPIPSFLPSTPRSLSIGGSDK